MLGAEDVKKVQLETPVIAPIIEEVKPQDVVIPGLLHKIFRC